MSNEEMMALIENLSKQVEEFSKAKPAVEKKNQKPQKASSNKYVLLSKELNSWGKVPQQQQDLAEIISKGFEVGAEVSEAELFDYVTENAMYYPSLAKSVQDPTYLFKYYRGLKRDGNHAGFVARNFIKVV